MPDIFVDTAGWGHLIDATQTLHSQAATIYRSAPQQGCKFITTNYVILELVALLISPLRIPRPTIIEFIESVGASPKVSVIHVDDALNQQAWQLFTQRQDKDWSLVDCASFSIMRQHGVQEALTTDHHFEQAGFVCLLKV